MPSYVTPKKNTEYIYYVGLVTRGSEQFQTNPTLAAGDVQISKDGGALNNLDTLPVVTPAASKIVKVTLSADEMDADNATVIFSDVAGNEWDDHLDNIQTTAQQIDDLSTLAQSDILDDATPFSGADIGTIEADVWGYSSRTLTMTAAEAVAAISGSTLTIRRGDTYELSLTDLGSIAGWDKLWFTIKTKQSDQDHAALILIEEGDGLLYSNGGAPEAAGNGSITVDDADDGDISIKIDEVETKKLAPQNNVYYDVQWRSAGDDVHTLTSGTCHITADVTRRIDE